MFGHFFREDPLFGARYAQLLDKVVQAFAKDLSGYGQCSHPIRATRCHLSHFVKDEINDCMRWFRMGVTPNLVVLPPELIMASKRDLTGHSDDGHGGYPTKKPHHEKERDGQDEPQWWSTSPQVVVAE
jgi:hypothetical protein